ncbi:pre-mRNA-splicing factor rse1, partial [Basidiobolus ranarum]
MFLYNITLQEATAINQAILGNFSGTKQQEIIIARNTRLVLLRPDPNSGKVHTVLSYEVFGVIRSLSPFRLTGGSKDYIVAGTDSGRVVILEYNPNKNCFEKVHQETYGKTGCRRVVPGQYLATDPKGRAVMIGAVEKQKLVYILNRDSAARLTISSPLEAHKSHTVVFACVGVDIGFENPIFACIEVDYGDADEDPTGEAYKSIEKMLTYYELDLGLNHVVRKWSDPIDLSSNLLIPVPGGTDGPSGVLVCSENFITYKHQGSPEHRVPIPRRENPLEDQKRGLIIVAGAVHKMKNTFFILVQSEAGDLYKVSVDYEDDVVQAIRIKYFDTVPVAAGLCILKSGFLFVASEFGNHYLYQFEKLGDDDDEIEYSSVDMSIEDNSMVYFKPHELTNLHMVDEMESSCPIIEAKVLNIAEEDTPQIYALTGRGSRSALKILRHGLEVSEMAVSELPGNPNAIWTTKLTSSDEYDSYMVVSFVNDTLVLSIGDTVEEVTDTGFINNTPTVCVQQMGKDSIVQIYPQGIRHIRADKRVNEWQAPKGRTIIQATANNRQVIIALSSGEIIYFELDNMDQLNEYQERQEMHSSVTCLNVGPVPEGRQRSKFLAVGCQDNTVRIISLDPDNCLETLSMQAVTATPESLAIIEMVDQDADRTHGTLYLNIGLQNGVLLRTLLDNVTGLLSDTRTRFLGSRPVKLFRIQIQGMPAVLALSSRPWLSYSFQSRNRLTPLSYEALEYGSGFCSEQCSEGIVAISANTLRILTVEKLGDVFNQLSIPLQYTPRRFVVHPASRNFVIIESEHNTYSPSEQKKLFEKKGLDPDAEANSLPADVYGLPKAVPGKWASCIRVLNPFQGDTLSLIELEDNEAAFSMTTLVFHTNPQELCLAVGTAKDVTLAPRTCSAAFIHLYKFAEDGQSLELVHKTPVDDIPLALLGFQGRLLAGVGKALRIYDVGKKKLLRKCQTKSIPRCIVNLHTQGSRIIICDIQESVHYATYKARENQIIIFADDSSPKWLTSTTMIDYDTVAGGDKFGNFFIERLPQSISQEVDDDPTGNKVISE